MTPGIVADVVLMPPLTFVSEVVEAGARASVPQTFQSPADNEIDVMFAAVAVVSETAEPLATVAEINSPTEPALVLLPSWVPTMPMSDDGLIAPDADKVVNAPVEVVVSPMLVPLIEPPVIATAAGL